MLADTQIFFLWTVYAVLIYWLVPSSLFRIRKYWLIFISVIFVYAYAHWAAIFVAYLVIVCIVFINLIQTKKRPLILWMGIFCVLIPLLSQRTLYQELPLYFTLGITFVTLRAVSIVFDAYTTRKSYSVTDVSLCLFFLPLYTVGPIEGIKKFENGFSLKFSTLDFIQGFVRTCLGIFKTAFIADQLIVAIRDKILIIEWHSFTQYTAAEVWGFVFLSFLYTYVNFSGFSDIAIGLSRLFGFHAVENFNNPLLSNNLQNFWKRWHISLGNWISKYVYFPVIMKLRNNIAPYAATLIAFFLIGYWHDAKVNYIIWGILHGTGLCMVLFWQQWLKRNKPLILDNLIVNRIYTFASWAVTITFVAWVQTFANQKDLPSALVMTRTMLGLG